MDDEEVEGERVAEDTNSNPVLRSFERWLRSSWPLPFSLGAVGL
jgi:hypothetical protein